MTTCTAAMITAFVLKMHAGQVYMGNSTDFHLGGRPHELSGLNTYRVTIEEVNRAKKAFKYSSTIKQTNGSWKFSKVGRWTGVEGLCSRVKDGEMQLDTRKGK